MKFEPKGNHWFPTKMNSNPPGSLGKGDSATISRTFTENYLRGKVTIRRKRKKKHGINGRETLAIGKNVARRNSSSTRRGGGERKASSRVKEARELVRRQTQ